MEGTGVAGGAVVIAARLLAGVPYVVSSGDAVAPFVAIAHRPLAPIAALYERLLCRLCAGFIGWTPYLVGRALTFGAPRGVTAAGWSPPPRPDERGAVRLELGIPDDAIVFGIVARLEWVERIGYCYGMELVRALRRTERDDLRVLVVGDGPGLERLREAAGPELGRRVLLPGGVPHESVPAYLSAIDVASLPQSVDGVGSFRYTTKLSEYMSAGLPVVTTEVPMAYDLDDGWIWRLRGETPWDPVYVGGLARLMRSVQRGEIEDKREKAPGATPLFERDRQRRRVTAFVTDLLHAPHRLAQPQERSDPHR
jgi:glycosyltransferase involved in cell wall biosynthesis